MRTLVGFVLSTILVASQTQAAELAGGSGVVSVDVLRHPITPKVRQRLQKALQNIQSGDHQAAIGQLRETLAKYPDSAPYVQNLLGVEYVKTDQVQAAIESFEQAVRWLPHDAMTHYSFALALVCARDYDRAAQEVQRALELDPKNPKMQARLNQILQQKR